MMQLIYIAGPFTAPTQWEVAQNVRNAESYGRKIALCGMFPVIPHVLGFHFGDECSAEFWYEGTLELMRRCNAVFMMPNWETSKGATEERRVAIATGMPVFTEIPPLSKQFGPYRS